MEGGDQKSVTGWQGMTRQPEGGRQSSDRFFILNRGNCFKYTFPGLIVLLKIVGSPQFLIFMYFWTPWSLFSLIAMSVRSSHLTSFLYMGRVRFVCN